MAFEADTWIPFVSGLTGALIGALSSLASTALAGRQRREDQEAAAQQRREEREATEKQQASTRLQERYDMHHERLRSDVMTATSGALSLAADIAYRQAPRWKYVTPAEHASFQARAAAVGPLLTTVAVFFPGDDVATAAKDTAIQISRSLGTLAPRQAGEASVSAAVDPEREEDEITQAAVTSALSLLDTVRLRGVALLG